MCLDATKVLAHLARDGAVIVDEVRPPFFGRCCILIEVCDRTEEERKEKIGNARKIDGPATSPTVGRMDRWTDGRMDGRTHGRMDGSQVQPMVMVAVQPSRVSNFARVIFIFVCPMHLGYLYIRLKLNPT